MAIVSAMKNLLQRYSEWLLAITLCIVVLIGWRLSRLQLIDAHFGLGYILGIVGLTMMVLILFYPLTKRLGNVAWLGSSRAWFRIHMLFGVLGPIILLFHANFSVDALNTIVVLFTMVLVTISGIVGRYLYRSIHKGFYGQRIQFCASQNQQQHPA